MAFYLTVITPVLWHLLMIYMYRVLLLISTLSFSGHMDNSSWFLTKQTIFIPSLTFVCDELKNWIKNELLNHRISIYFLCLRKVTLFYSKIQCEARWIKLQCTDWTAIFHTIFTDHVPKQPSLSSVNLFIFVFCPMVKHALSSMSAAVSEMLSQQRVRQSC